MKDNIEYTYYVTQEKNLKSGKTIARAHKISNNSNLLAAFQPFDGFEFISINAVSTYKGAKVIAEAWNNVAMGRNTYAF